MLCIQTASANFAEHPGCAGPGLIGKNSNSAGTLGLHMHSTFAVNGDGLPLIQFEAPDGRTECARPRSRPASALLEVRQAQAVQLPPPDGAAGSAPVAFRLVHVREEAPPTGAAPLEWFLLTSLEVAERVLDWYRLRWRIEDWHRVLKSGCQVEQLGHRRGERIERAVIAWRLTLVVLFST